jgi:hypothetical protein
MRPLFNQSKCLFVVSHVKRVLYEESAVLGAESIDMSLCGLIFFLAPSASSSCALNNFRNIEAAAHFDCRAPAPSDDVNIFRDTKVEAEAPRAESWLRK